MFQLSHIKHFNIKYLKNKKCLVNYKALWFIIKTENIILL